jgi:S-formylglutathione hydrolase FrmB
MALFEITMFSQALRRQVHLTAMLPVENLSFPGVPPRDKHRRFRSLYLLHGFSGTHSDWLRGSRIDTLAMLHDLAVFFPAGENSFYLNDNKRDALYEDFLCEELVEFTTRVFPLSDKRENRFIGGFSMGGYGALRNGLKRADVFGGIIALSSALITDHLEQIVSDGGNTIATPDYYRHVFGDDLAAARGGDADPKELARRLLESGASLPRVYMACGTEDFLLADNRSLHTHLEDIGFPHLYREGKGGHDWAFWDAETETALNWLDTQPG